ARPDALPCLAPRGPLLGADILGLLAGPVPVVLEQAASHQRVAVVAVLVERDGQYASGTRIAAQRHREAVGVVPPHPAVGVDLLVFVLTQSAEDRERGARFALEVGRVDGTDRAAYELAGVETVTHRVEQLAQPGVEVEDVHALSEAQAVVDLGAHA